MSRVTYKWLVSHVNGSIFFLEKARGNGHQCMHVHTHIVLDPKWGGIWERRWEGQERPETRSYQPSSWGHCARLIPVVHVFISACGVGRGSFLVCAPRLSQWMEKKCIDSLCIIFLGVDLHIISYIWSIYMCLYVSLYACVCMSTYRYNLTSQADLLGL